jgi:hypothetical protein
MPGLVPGIHVLLLGGKDVDGRVKPGHDDEITRDAEVSTASQPMSRGSASVHLPAAKLSSASLARTEREDVMERRDFLKVAFGFAAGAAAFAASAQAAPLMPHPLPEDGPLPPSNENARPAVTTGDEVEHLKPEEVRWYHRRWRRHWRRRRRWHRRYWRRRHYWGWRRRYWRRRYWRRRYWY